MVIISIMKAKETRMKLDHLKKYLLMIRSYLRAMINDYKTRREWRTQLTMWISFISFKDSKETRTMCTRSRKIEIMMGNETDDIMNNFANLFYKL